MRLSISFSDVQGVTSTTTSNRSDDDNDEDHHGSSADGVRSKLCRASDWMCCSNRNCDDQISVIWCTNQIDSEWEIDEEINTNRFRTEKVEWHCDGMLSMICSKSHYQSVTNLVSFRTKKKSTVGKKSRATKTDYMINGEWLLMGTSKMNDFFGDEDTMSDQQRAWRSVLCRTSLNGLIRWWLRQKRVPIYHRIPYPTNLSATLKKLDPICAISYGRYCAPVSFRKNNKMTDWIKQNGVSDNVQKRNSQWMCENAWTL